MQLKPFAKAFALIAGLCLTSASAPLAATSESGDRLAERPGCAGPEIPLEVVLPPELQAMLFHSLPIAGMIVTPDAIAERVLTNPRSRATAAPSITGKDAGNPTIESGAVGTHADLPD